MLCTFLTQYKYIFDNENKQAERTANNNNSLGPGRYKMNKKLFFNKLHKNLPDKVSETRTQRNKACRKKWPNDKLLARNK